MMLTDKFSEALALAIEAHDGQYRKGTQTPYISHPMAVASIALEFGADENQAIAALLHDVLEDGGLHYAPIIREKFGDTVYSIVMDCTDGTPDEHGEKSDWHERKINYLKHLHSISEDAILVVAADKLHNVRSIIQDLQTLGESVFERFTTKKEGTLWYYRSVADILHARQSEYRILITETLRHHVREMEKLTVKSTTNRAKLEKARSIECIKNSTKCGCYYCCSIFNPSEAEIDEEVDWIGCPNCGIDSVIGDFFGFKITQIKLEKLKSRQFYPIFYASYEIPTNPAN